MASIWMLSKESMKGMDIVAVLTDVLYASEQATLKEPAISRQELHEAFQRGKDFLSLLAASVAGQTQKAQQMDLFMLRVAESLEKSMVLTPTMLFQKLETAMKELESYRASSSTVCLFEKASEAVMNITSRSVEETSTSLR
jgi:hypothetical protein